MSLQEILADIHALEEDIIRFERLYGIRSDAWYSVYASGEEPADDAWTLDFAEWASVYRTWLERQAHYRTELQRLYPRSVSLYQHIRKAV
jgi:hypothetical protein